MDGSHILEIWHLFSEYIDKKSVEAVAEKFVDLIADLGVDDESLKEALGEDKNLDAAIYYYLDLDEVEDDEEWDL